MEAAGDGAIAVGQTGATLEEPGNEDAEGLDVGSS